ncbi:hypothetical protein [Roseicella frigidaeris]|uniref:Uncharacterized protein n=1 Tax=Roseicella frigidaeris TaxID=2230885 RepID=A0A327LV78_9PROT|nr:hypothetical protein [Roseicella frigidaeris]RAI54083.1 hypothetical protein DOO78_26545 [Roseicella frigidaeris]
MPASRPWLPPLAALGLLLLILPAAARVVEVAPGAAAEQGGTPAASQGAPCSCASLLPLFPFGWFGLSEAEWQTRWTAPLRAAVAAERARWRAARIAGRPRAWQPPPSLRPRAPR